MTHPAAYHPGPPQPTPEQRLLLLDEAGWELFIKDCVDQLQIEGKYVLVKHLGGPGDKGRDVGGYSGAQPLEATWDLYQAKFYAGSLAPSEFAPDLAKFLSHVQRKSYTRPGNYFLCASRGAGTSLFDYLNEANSLRDWILKIWKEKKGEFQGFKQPLTAELEAFILTFPFEIIKELTPADLLRIHERNTSKHWEKFGVLPRRGADPSVPSSPEPPEQAYVAQLLKVYSEQLPALLTSASAMPDKFRNHFYAQRRLFYCAEGLNRFSRDKLPGAFEALLGEIEVGIGGVLYGQYRTAMERVNETLQCANNLRTETNALKSRLQAGDLQGSCHHLANQSRIKWVEDEPIDGKTV